MNLTDGKRSGPLARLGWAAAVLLTLQGAGGATEPAQAGDLADVKARGKLIVAVFPIMGNKGIAPRLDMMREQGLKLGDLHQAGQFNGFDVDVLKGFADSLGVELEFRSITTGLKDMLPALLRHECDFVGGGITITPKRLAVADFSDVYFTSWLSVVARKDSPIHSVADLAGKTGAVLAASSHLEFLQQVAPQAKIKPVSYQTESIELVDAGEADFTIEPTDSEPGQPFSSAAPNLKIACRLILAPVGIAARKGSDLLPPLNAYLDRIRQSGELDRILARSGAVNVKVSHP